MPAKEANDPLIQEKLAELRDAYEHDTDAGLYNAVAEYFDLEGDQKRAILAAKEATSLEPDSASHHFALARHLLKAGRYRDGGQELEICSEIDSVLMAGRTYSENNLYYLGYALYNVERYKEAAEAFRGAQNLINIWQDPMVLKRFHQHQGFAWHREGAYLDAAECYRRAMVAPGPGDSCDEDIMDEDVVEEAQDYNDTVEPFFELAQQGLPLPTEGLNAPVTPSF